MTSSDSIHEINVKYPVFAAHFLSDTRLIVAGGGGEGNNGIKNKISLLDITSGSELTPARTSTIDVVAEYELPKSEDNPTSFAIDRAEGLVYAGVNRNMERVKKKDNDHLRILELNEDAATSKIAFDLVQTKSVFASGSIDEFQKITKFQATQNLLAISNSVEPGTLVVLNTVEKDDIELNINYTHIVKSGYINDFDVYDGNDYLVYATSERLVLLELATGIELSFVGEIEPGYHFNKIKFTGKNRILAVLSPPRKKAPLLVKFELTGEKHQFTVVKKATLSGVSAIVTGLDVSKRLAALTTADFSLVIVDLARLRVAKRFRNLHPFAITALAFNEYGSLLATGSAANLIKVIEIPESGNFNESGQTVLYTIASAVILVLVAVIYQYIFKNGYLNTIEQFKAASTVSDAGFSGDYVSSPSKAVGTLAGAPAATTIDENIIGVEKNEDKHNENVISVSSVL
jgi:prolactin regulatory element-binding protein